VNQKNRQKKAVKAAKKELRRFARKAAKASPEVQRLVAAELEALKFEGVPLPRIWPVPSYARRDSDTRIEMRQEIRKVGGQSDLITKSATQPGWMSLVTDPSDPAARERAYRYVHGWSS
jgi:hypothetical protein